MMIAPLFRVGVFTLLTASASAQYHVLPQGTAIWVDGFWVGPGYPYMGWSYALDPAAPDTVVDGVAYEHLDLPPFYAIRDNLQGQVFVLDDWSEGETLLYDFDVEVGDTIPFNSQHFYYDSLVVSSVDTVTVVGTERKRIGVGPLGSLGWPQQYWIQGIGSDGGLFNPCQGESVSGTSWLACMSENGIMQFGSGAGEPGDCLIYLGTEAMVPVVPELSVSTGPEEGLITLARKGETGTWQVSATNMQGCILGTWVMRSDRMDLSAAAWPPGLYVITASEQGSHRGRVKWIRP